MIVTRRGFARPRRHGADGSRPGGATQALGGYRWPSPRARWCSSISGLISNTNNGDKAEFDMPMLEALGNDLVHHQDALVQGSGDLHAACR